MKCPLSKSATLEAIQLSSTTQSSATSLEGVTIKRHALGELVRTLHALAERENDLFEKLKTAHAAEDREEAFRLTGELLSLRAEKGTDESENCTDQSV